MKASSKPSPVCIFVRTGAYDALHQGFAIAAAAVAIGRPVEMYFFWWALDRLVRGNLDEPDFEHADIAANVEGREFPTIRQLKEAVRESKLATLIACSGSMAALGLNTGQVSPHVDTVLGWTSILRRTSGVVDRFEL